jgi:hypothetical protein
MPYTHIPESGMAGGLAVIIGKIQGKISAQVMDGMADIVNQLQAPVCPSDSRLNQLDNKRNKLNNQLQSAGNALNRFRRIPGTLKPPLGGLKAAIRILLAIPIPQSVPPGFGIPVNITNKFGDIIVLLKEIVAQIGELIAAIEAALEVPSGALNALNAVAARVDAPLKSCRVQNALMSAIENLEVDPEILEESGLVSFMTDTNGNITNIVDPQNSLLSQAGPIMLNNASRDMSNNAGTSRGTAALTPRAQELLASGDLPDSARDAASDAQRRELLINDLLSGLNSLQQAELPDSLRDTLNDIATTFEVLGEQDNAEGASSGLSNIDPNDPRLSYTGEDGTVYKFVILPDPDSPAIAPRNYAQALDLGGTVRFTGPRSFSQDLDVLLAEVKFMIDNQDNQRFAAQAAVLPS